MSLNSVDATYTEHTLLYTKIRAVIAGKHELIKLVTELPAPMYRDLTTVNGRTTEQIASMNRQLALQTKRRAAYWSRGVLLNATGRTHTSLDGMLWAKDPDIEIPTQLAHMEESADGAGSGLREVVQDITDEVIALGRHGVLVDMPSSDSKPTLAEMESGALSPRLICYDAEQIIYYRNNGKSKAVDEVRLVEIKSVKKGDYEYEDEKFIRRLVMIDGDYVNQLFNDKDELIEESIPKANGKALTEIPFQFFGSDSNAPKYSKPPLLDLAMTNIGHFVLDCDNRDNLHNHGQGMTNVYTTMGQEDFDEKNPNGLDVGAKGMNMLDQGDKVEILQIGATGAIPAEMERDQQRMIAQGAQLVQDTNTNVTLGAKEMEFGASTATLKRIGRNVSIGIAQCLKWAAMFAGASIDKIKYNLNDKFVTDTMTPEMINAHYALVQGDVLPRASLYGTARSAGFTSDDDETIEADIEMQASMGGTTEEVAALMAEIERLNMQIQGAEE